MPKNYMRAGQTYINVQLTPAMTELYHISMLFKGPVVAYKSLKLMTQVVSDKPSFSSVRNTALHV